MSTRGGRRIGAGRKRGSHTKRVRETIEAATTAGLSPLQYMLSVLNDPDADVRRRDAMAIASAQFVHPRLAQVALSPVANSITIGSVVINSIETGKFVESGDGLVIEGSVDGAVHADYATRKLS